MTNRDKILTLVKAYETDPDALNGALIDQGLDPDGEYVVASKDLLYSAAVFVLRAARQVSSESEGGYSKSYFNTLDSLILVLSGGTAQPTVTNRSGLW